MFEAVAALCLAAAAEICRDVLLPGYEAPTAAACEAALAARPPTVDGTPLCKPVGEALAVEEVAPGVFVHVGRIEEPNEANRGDVANLGFVVGSESVAVIDAGSARWIGEALWRAVRARTAKPIAYAILTHHHPDHALGAAPFAEAGAEIVAHAGLARALADRQANYLESMERLIGAEAFLGTEAVRPTMAVEGPFEIDLGDRPIALTPWPAAHTGADLTALDRATGTLFAGDLVFEVHTPALDGRLVGWRAALEALTEIDAARVVPGHGAASLPWPGGAGDTARYLATLEADARAAVARGDRLGDAAEEIAAEEAERWELFEAYNPRNATVAFTEMEWE
ncbi:MAG: quinoprotein relay system zinc metallohydrolase 2 [Pseudomonadota bacterium]